MNRDKGLDSNDMGSIEPAGSLLAMGYPAGNRARIVVMQRREDLPKERCI